MQIVAAPASGGAETFVRDLSCELARQGHKVHMVFLDHAADLGRDPEFEVDFLSRLEACEVSYSFLGHDTRRRPWAGMARLRRLVSQQRCDLIHSHLAYGNIFAAAAPKVPLVYTHHSENARFPKAIWAYIRLRARRLIGISQACADNLTKFAGPSAPIEMIQNGIDLEGIQCRPTRRDRDVLHAICVGRITAQKNYPLLARAIAELAPKHQQKLIVDVYGEGDTSISEKCADILRAAGVPLDTMRFRGVTSKLRQILQEYDAFLMSSDWEGLPIALIEAAAAGLPSVVTDVGGCAEVTGTGPSGLIVPPGDIESFSGAIATLLNDANERELWSRNARETAKAFSITQSSSDHLQLYKEVI